MKRGIFIGRFQPFHVGHECVVRQMERAEDLDELVIGIGTSQISKTAYNPFTAEEREEMIKRSLGTLRKPYHIVKIPDINDYPRWVSHVISLTHEFEFQVVYAGNTIVKKLFEDKGYEVRAATQERMVSATEIRQLMVTGGNWKDYVPEGVAQVISEIDGVKRLRDISGKYMNPAVTVDIVISYKDQGIVLIRRKNEPYKDFWALPGGFLDAANESAAMAAAREANEETGLDIKIWELTLLGIYSNPGRDPRGPTVSVAYYTHVNEGEIKAGDDASGAKVFKNIPQNMAFDHRQILNDYFKITGRK